VNYRDEQIETVIDFLDQELGDKLIAVNLFGSRVNTKLSLRNDIDILVMTTHCDMSQIGKSMIYLLHQQETLYGDSNKLTHTPLLIVARDLPLFGPTFSMGIMNAHKCLHGCSDDLHSILLRHCGPEICHERNYIWMHIFWELLRVCKEIIDNYVEYIALKQAEKSKWINSRKTSRRIVKAFIYGCRLVGFLNKRKWCMHSFSNLEMTTGITDVQALVDKEIKEQELLLMLTPLYECAEKTWKSTWE